MRLLVPFGLLAIGLALWAFAAAAHALPAAIASGLILAAVALLIRALHPPPRR